MNPFLIFEYVRLALQSQAEALHACRNKPDKNANLEISKISIQPNVALIESSQHIQPHYPAETGHQVVPSSTLGRIDAEVAGKSFFRWRNFISQWIA